MPERATKRGAERTPLNGDYDAIVCGASFAGLAVCRELAGSGKNVLLLDRYEIGERQTSACAAPTEWLENLGLQDSIVQTFSELVIHRAKGGGGPRAMKTYRWRLPWSFSTFDYRRLCDLLKAQSPDIPFETAKVEHRTGDTIVTDRGELTAPLLVDALGWRRVLSNKDRIQPPKAWLSRGLEVHPKVADPGEDLAIWLDTKYVRPGYSWSFPAGDEVRVGVGSFDPDIHVKGPTLDLCADEGVPADGWQGNWIPHRLRPAAEDGVFFVGDSAGHCLPVTAEGIRPALYFGLAAGRELRAVLDGRQSRGQALDRYGSFSRDHGWAFRSLWLVQSLVSGAMGLPFMDTALDVMDRQRFVDWSFGHYIEIAPPRFVHESGLGFTPTVSAGAAAPAPALSAA